MAMVTTPIRTKNPLTETKGNSPTKETYQLNEQKAIGTLTIQFRRTDPRTIRLYNPRGQYRQKEIKLKF